MYTILLIIEYILYYIQYTICYNYTLYSILNIYYTMQYIVCYNYMSSILYIINIYNINIYIIILNYYREQNIRTQILRLHTSTHFTALYYLNYIPSLLEVCCRSTYNKSCFTTSNLCLCNVIPFNTYLRKPSMYPEVLLRVGKAPESTRIQGL